MIVTEPYTYDWARDGANRHLDAPSRAVHPLRGRVVIRPLVPTRIGSIILPDMAEDWERTAQRGRGILARSSHIGDVLALGAPALTITGAEVESGFEVGDRVVFVWRHNEAYFTRPWTDGLPVAWVAMDHVLAVIEALASGARPALDERKR
jgi:co-chaperonin GroES (HSP10)